MSDQHLIFELDTREIRALIRVANLHAAVWESVLESDADLASLTAPGVPPLQSAAMKLSVVLVAAQVEL